MPPKKPKTKTTRTRKAPATPARAGKAPARGAPRKAGAKAPAGKGAKAARPLPRALAPAAARRLQGILEAPGFRGRIGADDVKRLQQDAGLDDPYALMVLLLPYATTLAKPPISSFQVGAVSMGSSGALYFGANLEFVGEALSFTVHAEQSATTSAWAAGETGLLAIAVSAAPCGYCRQYLYELVTAAQLQVVLPTPDGSSYTVQPLTSYLPDPFGPHDLGVQGGLMQPTANGLVLDQPTPDPVIGAALSAANASYAPYTKGFAGVALQTSDGTVYAAPYCDNAAFNPAMSPLEAALSCLNVGGHAWGDVTRAVLVQALPTACLQEDATRVVLGVLSDVPLEVYTAHAQP